jgi:hypothetical protein
MAEIQTLTATITCPSCGERTEAEMPTDACQFFWRCPACDVLLRPEPGDCCVFCSFADASCPPVQLGRDGAGGCRAA